MFEKWPKFDELKKIAQDNPEALERFRKQQIDELIENAPEDLQRRLKGLQFQIDCKRRTHKSPLSSCISISKMMHESVNRLNEVLNGHSNDPAEADKAATGQVLSFPVTG